MRNPLPNNVERGREVIGPYGSSMSDGPNGRFFFKLKDGEPVCVLSSDGMGWEHVSVSLTQRKRCPSWEQMCEIKGLFWYPEETVIQYHPAEEDYVNCHPYVLHLWRPLKERLPKPPSIMVGIKR